MHGFCRVHGFLWIYTQVWDCTLSSLFDFCFQIANHSWMQGVACASSRPPLSWDISPSLPRDEKRTGKAPEAGGWTSSGDLSAGALKVQALLGGFPRKNLLSHHKPLVKVPSEHQALILPKRSLSRAGQHRRPCPSSQDGSAEGHRSRWPWEHLFKYLWLICD